MTRLWTDGFELGDFAGYSLIKFREMDVVTNSDLNSNGGGRSIYFNPYGSGQDGFQEDWGLVRSLEQDLNEVYIRTWVYFADPMQPIGADQETFLTLLALTGTMHLGFSRNKTTGNIIVHRTGFATILPGHVVITGGSQNIQRERWYCIEVRVVIADVGGVVQVRVDGGPSLDIDFVGDTRNSASWDIHSVAFGSVIDVRNAVEPLHGYIDDIAINDTAGAVDNSWCGMGKVIYLPVTTDAGPNEWLPSDELGGQHADYLDDVPHDSDTTFLSTHESGLIERFETTNSGMEGPLVLRAWAEGRIRRVDASSTVFVQLGVNSSVATDWSPDREMFVSYEKRILGNDLKADPHTGNAWTIGAIDAARVSIKSVGPE